MASYGLLHGNSQLIHGSPPPKTPSYLNNSSLPAATRLDPPADANNATSFPSVLGDGLSAASASPISEGNSQESLSGLDPNCLPPWEEIRPPHILLVTNAVHRANPEAKLFGETFDLAAHTENFDFEKDVRNRILKVEDGLYLDGLYLQWTEDMTGAHAEILRRLCENCIVGVWQYAHTVDSLLEASRLIELGVTFVNTDLPREWLGHLQKCSESEETPHLGVSASDSPTDEEGGANSNSISSMGGGETSAGAPSDVYLKVEVVPV